MPNKWTREMPSGWMPGCCAICDIPCGQEQYKRTQCPFERAKQEPDKTFSRHEAEPREEVLREELADLEHRRWSSWQSWCHKVLRENCPSEAMEKVLAHWDKQIATDYKNLSEREKDMDRKEADKTLSLMYCHPAPAKAVEPLACLAERKGFWKTNFTSSLDAMANRYWSCEIERMSFNIKIDIRRQECFVDSTYPAAEAKARQYLNGLEDVK